MEPSAVNKYNVYKYDTPTLDSNVFVITIDDIDFKSIREYGLFVSVPKLIFEDVDDQFLEYFFYTNSASKRDINLDLRDEGYAIINVKVNTFSKPGPHYLTAGALRKAISNAPDDTPVYYQRIEDFYFDGHGWETKIFSHDGEHEYIIGWAATYSKDQDCILIDATY